jgi:hypothetical protein
MEINDETHDMSLSGTLIAILSGTLIFEKEIQQNILSKFHIVLLQES